jgi:hypothetical protein
VRGGHPAILAGHLVACRRRQLADRWSHLQGRGAGLIVSGLTPGQ